MLPRKIELFEVPEEDFLTERPEALSADWLLANEIIPPNWALKCLSKFKGRRPRGGHWEKQFVTNLVPIGSGSYSPMGAWGPMGPLNSADSEYIYNKHLDKRRRKKAQQLSARKQVTSGNLREDDYRFWKGWALEGSERYRASCKWCEQLCLGREAMDSHHDNGWCKDHLLALYRYAFKSSKQRYCFSCKRETRDRRWGLPLCKTPSCIALWKFNFNSKLNGYVNYRRWAAEDQARNPTGGPYAGLAAMPSDEDDLNLTGVPC